MHLTVTPRAVDDTWTTPANTPLTVPAPGVLGNDLGTGLTAGSPSDPPHGSVTLDPSGALVYTPDPDFTGTDTFTYTATDTAGQTTGATVTIHVHTSACRLRCRCRPPRRSRRSSSRRRCVTPTVHRPTSLTVTVTIRTGGSAGLATTGFDPVSALLLAFSLVGAGVALSVGRRRLRRV